MITLLHFGGGLDPAIYTGKMGSGLKTTISVTHWSLNHSKVYILISDNVLSVTSIASFRKSSKLTCLEKKMFHSNVVTH